MSASSKVNTVVLDLTDSPKVIRVGRYHSLRKAHRLNLSKLCNKGNQSAIIYRDNTIENYEDPLFIGNSTMFNPKSQSSQKSNANLHRAIQLRLNQSYTTKNSIHGKKWQFDKYVHNRKKKKEAKKQQNVILDGIAEIPQQEAKKTINQLENQKKNEGSENNTKSNTSQKSNTSFRQDKKKLVSTLINQSLETQKLSSSNKGSESSKLLNKKKNYSIPLPIKPRLLPTIKKETNRVKNGKDQSPSKRKQTTVNKNIPILCRDPEQLKFMRADSYCVIEYPTENLIVTHKGINAFEIASLTKIMTFYCVRRIQERYGLNICEQKVTITDHAMQMSGTSAEIATGEIYTVQNLLYGLMLPSGNDAAVALALWGGKQIIQRQSAMEGDDEYMKMNFKNKMKVFLEQMNSQAQSLNLTSTFFANPHGLPHQDSKSTAIQVARLSAACMKDQVFVKVIKTQKYQCQVGRVKSNCKKMAQWTNTNKLLRRKGFIGIKTGITVTAGPCLATAYQFRDKIYIVVILRANKVSRRFSQTRKLLFWALSKYYKDCLSGEQVKTLQRVRRDDGELDSDYSEDEQEFNYELSTKEQYKKRCDIIKYQM